MSAAMDVHPENHALDLSPHQHHHSREKALKRMRMASALKAMVLSSRARFAQWLPLLPHLLCVVLKARARVPRIGK
jgi:hypothetical protein